MRGSTHHANSGFRDHAKLVLARLFPEREIILRTGLRRRRFAISTGVQATVVATAVITTVWQTVVTSQWLDSAATIAAKDYQIVDLRVDRKATIRSMSEFERRFHGLTSRISTEMADIERNLTLLANHDSITSEPIAAYAASVTDRDPRLTGDRLGGELDAQLARLEESLFELRTRHSVLLATSAQTASAQLEQVEGALRSVGIHVETFVAQPVDLCADDVGLAGTPSGDDSGRGGPFIPLSLPGSRETGTPRATLHETMRRWNSVVAATGKLPLGTPVEGMYLSSTFGRRRDPFNRRLAVHAGIDYAGAYNKPVMATGAGVVTFAGRNGRYGKLVQIDHGYGFVTRYAHLAELSVKVGQQVERGTQVGLVGSTGRSTGPHLHYELRVGNQPRDPLKFIEVGRHVFKRNSTEVGPG